MTADEYRKRAQEKVDAWLEGVDAAAFESALVSLVEDKASSGEYRFKRASDRELAMQGARRFFADFARKIVPLSDGRCVYFVPDARSSDRNASKALSWAEYAFHAVSAGGAKVPGRNYNERWYNPHKARNLQYLEEALRDEHCFVRLSKVDCRYDSVMFAGRVYAGEAVQVVTRLDEMGNMDANLSEVTFNATRRQEKKLPRFVPLTEAVQAVVHHQVTAGSYPQDKDILPFPVPNGKGVHRTSRSGTS